MEDESGRQRGKGGRVGRWFRTIFFFLIKGRQITGKIGREVRNYMLVTN